MKRVFPGAFAMQAAMLPSPSFTRVVPSLLIGQPSELEHRLASQ